MWMSSNCGPNLRSAAFSSIPDSAIVMIKSKFVDIENNMKSTGDKINLIEPPCFVTDFF